MKKDWKYIVYISVAVALYLGIKVLGPREHDWNVTFHPDDRNPFGGYVLSELLPGIFPEEKLRKSNLTIYELYDSLDKTANLLSISTSFSAGKEDTRALLKNLEKGGSAFIAAQYFSGTLADTFHVTTKDYFFDSNLQGIFDQQDTSTIIFKNPMLQHAEPFYYPRSNVHNYFHTFDSTRATIIAVNDLKLPVLIRLTWGKGNLYLSSTPMAFTNIYMLASNNTGFVERALSYLPAAELEWTEFYHLGRLEIETPLRFILSKPALAWAYYILIGGILFFMIFEIKRKQRIIPVIKPPRNSTLDFVATVGDLYYRNGDHKNIAEKKITFFLEQIRTKYYLETNTLDDEFQKALARKSGNSEQDVADLFAMIRKMRAQENISPVDLMGLNMRIENFNTKA